MDEQKGYSIRGNVYRILRDCFCYPDQGFFQHAQGNLVKDLEENLSGLPYKGDIKESCERFTAASKQVLDEVSLEDLQVEYTGLFIYGRGTDCCFPYESMHRKGNRRLMGDATMIVRRFYRGFGVGVSPSFRDLPDHIAAELEFMDFLSLNEDLFGKHGEKDKEAVCLSNEITFLNNHPLTWVPQFAACVKQNATAMFFIALAELTRDFLAADAHYLSEREKTKRSGASLTFGIDSKTFNAASLRLLEPVEVSVEPEVRWVYTTSPERLFYSPVKVKVVDGRAEKMVARDDVPFFDGKQEVRAFGCFAKLYASDKLKFPLKRIGERGEGKFKRISWEEALGEIARVFRKYRDEGKAKQVAFLRTHPPLEFMFNHFTHHYGTPNDIHTSTTSCFADARVAQCLTAGEVGSGELGADDYLNSEYALYIGHNLLNGIRQIPRAARFAEAIRRGMKFVFVDPRLNEGSYTYGSEWVPIKPGTDTAFIMALIHVIVRERLFDEQFLLNHTNAPILIKPDRYPLKNKNGDYLVWDTAVGEARPIDEGIAPALLGAYQVKRDDYHGECKTAFQHLAERAENYTPEEVASITTIGKEKLEEIARKLGTKRPHVCIFSQPNVSAQYSNSLQRCRARNVLMSLLGIFDKPGGKYFEPSESTGIELNKPSAFRIPIEVYPMDEERVDYDPTIHPSMNTSEERYPLGSPQNLLKAIKTGKPYPIKALFIIGSDVVASQPGEWREAFKKVEFIVKSHVWPDDDVDYADIVLPEPAFLERDDGFAQSTVHDPEHKEREFSFLTVTQKVVESSFEERPWTEYAKELAQRIGFGAFYDFTLDEYWVFLLEPMGIDMNYLRKHGVYYPTPLVTRKIDFGKKGRWGTDTGRLNIYSCETVDLWHEKGQDPQYDPLPVYHPITVEPAAENEFYLISGKCSYFWCNYYRNNALLLESYLEGELGNTLLWINAAKAGALGIQDRDWVWIESKATGQKDKVMVKVTEGIHPSAVWHPYGYGHRSSLMDKRSRARKGINVQDFLPLHNVPWTGGAAHCEAVIRIYRAEG